MSGRLPGLLVVAVVVSTLAAASMGYLLSRRPDAPPSVEPARESVDVPERASTLGVGVQLEDMRREIDELRSRVARLEQRGEPHRSPAGDWATRQELEELKKLEDKGAIERTPSADEFKLRVAEAMSALEKDKVQDRLEKAAARLDERVAWLTDKLQLNGYQASEMRSILGTFDAQSAVLVQMWQDGVADEILGETKRSNEEEFEAGIQRVLSPEQVEAYREIERGEEK